MKELSFIGREQEIKELQAVYEKGKASFVVVKGRRRIGKSRLVAEFSKNFSDSYFFSGLAPSSGIGAVAQRREFRKQFERQFNASPLQTNDWSDLFYALSKQIDKKKKTIIFLDEISWMAIEDVTFLSKLKNAWDLYFNKYPKLMLIICSSISSWLDRNILNSTAFLGRISYVITLKQLSLRDSVKFFGKYEKRISAYEKILLLNLLGGVPRYLEEINARLNIEENIKNIFFNSSAFLFNEFENIFSDLFQRKAPILKKIVEELANKSSSFEEIVKKANLSQGGVSSKYLEDLIQGGFVTKDSSWKIKSGKISKIAKYRLSDNYLRFYLKYIAPYKEKIAIGSFPDKSFYYLNNLENILGLQFENLVLANRELIYDELRIDIKNIVASNPFYQTATKLNSACQIDFLIETRFNTLYLCEIKFTRGEIGLEVIREVEKKISKLVIPKNFTVRPVLIYVGGVSEGVFESRYFDTVISFEKFLS